MDDASSIIEGSSALRSGSSPCNVTIDSSSKATGLITMTFNGNNCDNSRSRSGTIAVQLAYDNATSQVIKCW